MEFYSGGYNQGIYQFTSDGKNKTKIIDVQSTVYGGLTIAVWKGKKHLYFAARVEETTLSDGSKIGKGTAIRRANLDGSGITDLVAPNAGISGTVSRITVDDDMGYIYWETSYNTALLRAPIDLNPNEPYHNRSDIQVLSRDGHSAMKLVNGSLYWSSSGFYEKNATKNEPYYFNSIWRWKVRYENVTLGDMDREK